MSPARSNQIGAAIDVGGNSVHLLVARIARRPGGRKPARLEKLDDRSDLLGLGDTVDRHGLIPPEPLHAAVESVRGLVDVARAAGAREVAIVGTDPLRRAVNGDDLAAAVLRYVGSPVHVISERQEAELTFVGVTGAQLPNDALAVVDIGGGSTEAGLHQPGRPLGVVPLGVGSARLTNAIVRHDPPTSDEIARLLAEARQAIAQAPWPDQREMALDEAVFVGGTATNIGRLGRLSISHLGEDLEALMELPADAVVEHYGVRPRRARQLAAGIAIVLALLERFGLAEAEVSEASLRDGAILAVGLLGAEWLERLPELSGGAP